MIDQFLYLIAGTVIGILTGILPGLHVNLLIPLIPSIPFLIGVAVSHTFFDFIPSLLLGVPDESSSIASLPGHRLVLSGNGYEAFLLTVLGGLLGIISLIALLPIFLIIGYPTKTVIIALLFILITSLVLSQRNKLGVILVLLASGFLGLIVHTHSYGSLPAYFTGLFGVPTVIYALFTKSTIPKQKVPKSIKVNWSVIPLSSIGGILAGILPGITSSISAVFLDNFFRFSDRAKMLLVGGINTVYVVTSVLAIWLIGHPRSGIALAIPSNYYSAIPLLLLAVSISSMLAFTFGTRIFIFLSKLDSKLLNIFAVFVLTLIMFFVYPHDLALFLSASSLGLLAYSMGVSRSAGLGFIILPILSTYLCGIY